MTTGARACSRVERWTRGRQVGSASLVKTAGYVAFWIAALTGAVVEAEGPKWLCVSLVIAVSCVSAWTGQ